MSTTHSEKALKTIALMGTTPADWTLTEIDWVEEERMVPGDVTCPDCQGGRFVVRAEDGTIEPIPADDGCSYERRQARQDYERRARVGLQGNARLYGNCTRCINYRRRGTYGQLPTGKVRGLVLAKVMVGYPRFPAGTAFDSRFVDGEYRCHLCAKRIEQTLRVPVNTAGEKPHGMWVGQDCARKFLNVKIKRAADSIMEDPR